MSNESTVIGKSQCPHCAASGRDRSADNLAEYSDGHAFCFGCSYYRPADKRKQSLAQLNNIVKASNDEEKVITLPTDRKINFPYQAGNWLSSYGITMEETLYNDITWSPSLQGIVFPFYLADHKGNVKVQGYQVRNFVAGRPKYLTVGPKDDVFWWHGLHHTPEHGIILTEDCVSALKVGRYACTIPLLGSSLPRRKQIDLKQTSNKLFFWLDSDKVGEAYKYAELCAHQGYQTSVIVTPEDPKWYYDDEIKEILSGAGY